MFSCTKVCYPYVRIKAACALRNVLLWFFQHLITFICVSLMMRKMIVDISLLMNIWRTKKWRCLFSRPKVMNNYLNQWVEIPGIHFPHSVASDYDLQLLHLTKVFLIEYNINKWNKKKVPYKLIFFLLKSKVG